MSERSDPPVSASHPPVFCDVGLHPGDPLVKKRNIYRTLRNQIIILRCTQICNFNIITFLILNRECTTVGNGVVLERIYDVILERMLLFSTGSYPGRGI